MYTILPHHSVTPHVFLRPSSPCAETLQDLTFMFDHVAKYFSARIIRTTQLDGSHAYGMRRPLTQSSIAFASPEKCFPLLLAVKPVQLTTSALILCFTLINIWPFFPSFPCCSVRLSPPWRGACYSALDHSHFLVADALPRAYCQPLHCQVFCWRHAQYLYVCIAGGSH